MKKYLFALLIAVLGQVAAGQGLTIKGPSRIVGAFGASGGSNPITLIGTPTGNSAFGSSTTIASTATAHTATNTLVVNVAFSNNHTITVANTAGDTWSSCPATNNGDATSQIFYVLSTAGNASDVVTATANSAGFARVIHVSEWSGILSSSATDICGGAPDKSDGSAGTCPCTIQPNSFTTLFANELIIVAGYIAAGGSGATMTADTNYTLIAQTSDKWMGVQYRIPNAIQTAINPALTFPSPNGAAYNINVITLKGH